MEQNHACMFVHAKQLTKCLKENTLVRKGSKDSIIMLALPSPASPECSASTPSLLFSIRINHRGKMVQEHQSESGPALADMGTSRLGNLFKAKFPKEGMLDTSLNGLETLVATC